MTNSTLTPISAGEAVELYKDSRQSEVSSETLQAHNYRLTPFIRWCEGDGDVANLNSLTGRALYEYRKWRRDDGDLNPVTLRTQLSTLRVFMKFCESIDAVQDGIAEKVVIPTLTNGEGQRTETLSNDRADRIFEYLNKYEYASRDHALLAVLWHTGLRIGEAHALDVDDFHPDEQRLGVHHRPEGGTTLKNGESGERLVALKEQVCEVLTDYLKRRRIDATDGDRDPLFTSKAGRPAKTTLRATVYRLTQPCLVADCPIGRDPEQCEDRGRTKCPETVSPHDVRRGAITHFLSSDVPEKVVSDRMDVSDRVLEAHYDQRSEERKTEQRREYLEDV